MKINKIIFWIALVIMLSSGCKKYLEQKSNAKLVTPKTLTDIQGLLDDPEYMNIKTTPSLGESSADDYFMLPTTYNALNANYQNMYRWVPVDIRYGNDWMLSYLAIYNANLSMDLLSTIERDNANATAWDNIRGSALFYRAFYLLGLCGNYAKVYNDATANTDLGVVLRLNSDFNVPSARASVSASFAQIIADATESITLLPDYPQQLLRPSKGAAYALLARTYLYMGKYEQARTYAEQALKLNNSLMDYNADTFISPLTASAPFKKFNSETIFYTEMGQYNVLHSTSRGRIDTTLVSSYITGDLRRTGFFTSTAGYQQFKGNYTSSSSAFFSGLATDEMYLIRAEANAYLGLLDAALADVNTLLKKRWDKTKTFIPATGTTREGVLARVKLERRKELLMRGLRWMDIKRYIREGDNIVLKRKIGTTIVTLEPNSAYYALPIPIDIIEQSGIKQN